MDMHLGSVLSYFIFAVVVVVYVLRREGGL